HEDHMHRLIANVLRGMGQRVAIDNVARLERALRDLAICCVVAIPTPCQNIDDVGGVRVHLLFGTWWQDRFAVANTIVFESVEYCLLHNDGRISRDCMIELSMLRSGMRSYCVNCI